MEGLITSIKKGKPGKLTVDNIDGMMIARDIRLHKGNRHYHYAASTYIPDRINVKQMRSLPPPIPDNMVHTKFFLSNEEEIKLKEMYSYMVCTDNKVHAFME